MWGWGALYDFILSGYEVELVSTYKSDVITP